MVYSIQNAAFRRDKHQFFSQLSLDQDARTQFPVIEHRAQTIDYSFLLRNQNALEVEFTDLFNLLQKHDGAGKESFWFYCYYSATLLEHFHRAYEQESKEAHYIKIKEKIKKHLYNEQMEPEEEQSFTQSIYQSFLSCFKDLVNIPYHLSKIRDNVAYANLCRLYWIFSRLTLTTGLTVAKNLHLIEKLDAILGTHIDVDKIIATVQAPTQFITYFSVGFFLMRFAIDAGLLIKHTFFPSELAQGVNGGHEINKMTRLPGAVSIEAYRNTYIMLSNKEAEPVLYYVPKQGQAIKLLVIEGNLNELQICLANKKSIHLTAEQINSAISKTTGHVPEQTTSFERFKHELYKRHCNFTNDLVWATVNFLTNYNNISGIPGPITGYITAVFLIFDVAMTLHKCQLAKNEYLTKKAQYLAEIAEYNDPLQCEGMADQGRMAHIALLTLQLEELDCKWKAKEAMFHFAAAAATLFMVGFTASLILNPPLLIVASYFACTVAAAMYMSTDVYAQYQEKNQRLERAQLTGEHLALALKEKDMARNHFIFTMTKNTVVPLMLITTFAICWPAAVALTALYIGSELLHAYGQHNDSKMVKKLAAPEDEADNEDRNSAPAY